MIEFNSSKNFSIGAELELQLINASNFDLHPCSLEILSTLPESLQSKIKSELFQSMIEVNSSICDSAIELEDDLKQSIKYLLDWAQEKNVLLVSLGTHPFAKYDERLLYPNSRYYRLIERNKWLARRLAIFGFHIHIGMRSGEHCIEMMKSISHFLPHLTALCVSSPFWFGRDTGLASSRSTIFESIPTGGHPCMVENWKHFNEIVTCLFNSKAISSLKDIWWDLRPSVEYGTLELRVFDSPPSIRKVAQTCAITHCLVHALDDGMFRDRVQRTYQDWIVRENKWRVARHGLDADIIIDSTGETRPLREDLDILLNTLQKYFIAMKYETYWEELKNAIRSSTSSDKQRNIFNESGNFDDVLKQAAFEFRQI